MKQYLGILLTALLVLTLISPVSASETLGNLNRNDILKVPAGDATLVDNLNLDINNITWTSSDPEVIDPETGVVTRPELTKSVILIASEGSMTKEFAFRVLGKDEPIGGEKAIPKPGFVVYGNDFSGTKMDTEHMSFSANCTQDGAVYLTRALGSPDEAFGGIYPNGLNGSGLEGQFVTEYVLDKFTVDNGAYPCFHGSDGSYYLRLQSWSRSNGFNVIGKETKHYSYDEFGMASAKLKVTVLFDTVAGTFDLWVNNQFVTSGESAGAADVRAVSFATGADASISGSHKVDDLVVYYTDNMKTFYKDSFEGDSLPANVKTAGGATIDTEEKAIKMGSGFMTLNLNDSGMNIDGKITTDFTITRPAYHAGNCQFWLLDENNAPAAIFTWFAQGTGLYAYYRTSADAASDTNTIVPTTIYDTFVNIRAIIDAETSEMNVWVNKVKVISGYTQSNVDGVAALRVYDNANSGQIRLTKVNCYGIGSYNKPIVYYEDNFEGTSLPDNVIDAGGAVIDTEAQAIKLGSGYMKMRLNDAGTDINENVTVEFTITRPAYHDGNCQFFIKDTSGKNYTYGTWFAHGGGLYTYAKATPDATEGTGTLTSGMTTYSISANIKAVFEPETSRVTVYVNNTQAATGYALSDVPGVAQLVVFDNGNTGEIRLTNVKCYGTSKIDMPEDELPVEVTDFSMDYNAYDKKVCIASPITGDFMLIAAAYRENETLVSVAAAAVSLKANGEVLADTSALRTEDAAYVKLLRWNNFTTIQPIGEVINVEGAVSAY